MIHDEEIELLNRIKPGKYLQNVVTVFEKQKGDKVHLHIVYANKTPDQRFTNSQLWSGKGKKSALQDMLEQIDQEGGTAPSA